MAVKNIGIIGGGYWGKNLVRVLHELDALKVVCDLDEEVLAGHKEKYGCEVTNRHQDLLEDDEVSGVVIAAPAALHYKLAQEALLAGKDVFVEKPLALGVAHGEELVKIAKNESRILMVGHILLYHSAVLKLKEMIDGGELGEILYVYSNRLNMGKLRREENVLWSFAPHDISVMLHLLGESPKKVETFSNTFVNEGISDVTIMHLDFEKAAGHIFVSWLNPFKEQKLTVVGDKKMAVFDDTKEEKLMVYEHVITNEDGSPVSVEKCSGSPIALEMSEPLKAEVQHFLDCIASRKAPRSDGEEGLRVLKVLDLAQKTL